MKIFATVLSVLAFVGVSISQNTCTADDVLNSLSSVEHYADKMQSVTDSSNDDIDPSAPIFKNFESQTKHFNGDLQCTFNTALAEQTAICSAYETFATSQLGYLHVADGRAFYEKNGHGDNAIKMHEYILQSQHALENYTTQVKAAAASCVDRIETAYTPLGTQLQNLLQAYPGAA
ncbi:hypothetical protein Pdw03_6171 [Penicillium digitatum]|uniref:Uncharacterized protein n=1 Tax=Penicillium digitatum TaxID=36651 RepID=A0A7T6XJI2_PENDI|nr:hypothetical protein PDIDSM_2383 [Penicillium digitatum]QQK42270.1 hypothetical protein Pdw03_6171 [Penicillium digitatum]